MGNRAPASAGVHLVLLLVVLALRVSAEGAAPVVVLTAPGAPRLLLAGVAVPIPFSLRAAGIECEAGADDCLLVEAVLDPADCARGQPDAKAGEKAQRPRCKNGDGVDVSRAQDCGVLKRTLAAGDGVSPPPGAQVTALYTYHELPRFKVLKWGLVTITILMGTTHLHTQSYLGDGALCGEARKRRQVRLFARSWRAFLLLAGSRGSDQVLG